MTKPMKARLVIKLKENLPAAFVVMIGGTIVCELGMGEVQRAVSQYERLTHNVSKNYDENRGNHAKKASDE